MAVPPVKASPAPPRPESEPGSVASETASGASSMPLSPLIRAMRPHQWVKNVFVLAALAFTVVERGSIEGLGESLTGLALAFFAFCLGASAIYLVNDVMDVESDRMHPVKRLRPIAAGELSIPAAYAASAACIGGALTLGFLAGGELNVAVVVGCYIAMNFAYSVKLKHVVIVDAFIIATGFLLRVGAGGLAAGVPLSHWIFLCTFFLALFLALCKRRAETDLLGEGRGEHRAILRDYNTGFLDQMVTILAACTIVCYTMYTVSPETVEKFGNRGLVGTVPFVVFGLARYMLLVQTQKGGDNPTKVLLGGDAMFVANGLCWMAAVAFVTLQRFV